jgi:hypothetical protein
LGFAPTVRALMKPRFVMACKVLLTCPLSILLRATISENRKGAKRMARARRRHSGTLRLKSTRYFRVTLVFAALARRTR